MNLIYFFLILSIIIESTFSFLPLTLLIIIFSSIVIRKNDIFILAFFSGLFLDIFSLRTLGISSLIFVLITFLIFLYQKKFELETTHFIFMASLVGSFLYLFFTGSSNVVLGAIISSIISSVSFLAFAKTRKKSYKYI